MNDKFIEKLIDVYNTNDDFAYYLRDWCYEWDFFDDDPDDY